MQRDTRKASTYLKMSTPHSSSQELPQRVQHQGRSNSLDSLLTKETFTVASLLECEQLATFLLGIPRLVVWEAKVVKLVLTINLLVGEPLLHLLSPISLGVFVAKLLNRSVGLVCQLRTLY